MDRRKHLAASLVLWIAILAMPCAGARIIYVDDDANAPGDGSSWQTAYKYLQDALNDASSSEGAVEIRVAKGMYKPDQGRDQTPGDREATFRLIDSVNLQGGYAGPSGADPNLCNTDRYETILSGDLAGNDIALSDPCNLPAEPSRTDNSCHVLSDDGTEPNVSIAGFTITGGNAEPVVFPVQSAYPPLGGGAGMNVTSGRLVVTNCRFAGNLAGHGGAIYAGQSYLILMNCTFTNNLAAEATIVIRDGVTMRGGGSGGAVFTASGNCAISGCGFTGNVGLGGGGGVSSSADSKLTLEDCLFLRNSAYYGGAVYCAVSSLQMTRCTFRRNVASRVGGAIGGYRLLDAASADCVFAENWARDGGGAIHNGARDFSLVRCVFTRNRTPSWGGAMYNLRGEANLSNCLLEGNVGSGGALCNSGGHTLTLVNCTIVGNSGEYADGLLFREDGNTMQMSNCIVRNGVREIANEGNSAISVTYTNIAGGWPGEGNLDVDPCFASPGQWDPNGTLDDPNDDFFVEGDYRLKSQAGRWDPAAGSWVVDDVTSPCIDAGDPNSPVGEEPFPNGGRVNMGAYGGTGEASKSYFDGPVCETIIAGDVNGDCRVDFADLQILVSHWLEEGDAAGATDPGAGR